MPLNLGTGVGIGSLASQPNKNPAPPPTIFFILMEDEGKIVVEDGGSILME